MEFSEVFRFCWVCLVPEEKSESFTSIFAYGGQIVVKLHRLTGIIPVDVDTKVPSMICEKCLKDVYIADNLRKRILDAHEHVSMMTSATQVELFEDNLQMTKQITKKNVGDKREKDLKIFAELSTSTDAKSSESFLPLVFIDRKDSEEIEDKIAKLAEDKSRVSKEAVKRKPKRKLADPKSNKKLSLKPKIISKIVPKRVVSTTFECDTCKECFYKYSELNKHMDSHEPPDSAQKTLDYNFTVSLDHSNTLTQMNKILDGGDNIDEDDDVVITKVWDKFDVPESEVIEIL